MSRVCYSLPAPTREEATRWLRRKLAMVRDEAPPPKPRALRAWLGGALRVGVEELQGEMVVAVFLADGSVWLGVVRETSEVEIVLVAWGAGDLMIAVPDIAAVKLVPAHSWAEQRIVAERQRRGEPTLVLPVRKPTNR
ncbi:MAG: hypothetical protein IPM35_27990 [Myxococcales bacterium]|nr:hypothetical protein [Myxococcales bacterium]